MQFCSRLLKKIELSDVLNRPTVNRNALSSVYKPKTKLESDVVRTLSTRPSDTFQGSKMVLSVVAGLIFGLLSVAGIAKMSDILLKDAQNKSHLDVSEHISHIERWA